MPISAEQGFNPPWTSFSESSLRNCLTQVDVGVLWSAYSVHQGKQSLGSGLTPGFYVDTIARYFVAECGSLNSMASAGLRAACEESGEKDRYALIGKCMERWFGRELLYLLSRPAQSMFGPTLAGVREEMSTLQTRTDADVETVCASFSPSYLRRIIALAHFSRGLVKQLTCNVSVSSVVSRFFCIRRAEVARATDEENRGYIACLDPLRPRSVDVGLRLGRERSEFGVRRRNSW